MLGESMYIQRILSGLATEDTYLRRGELEMIARRAYERAGLPEECPDPAELAVGNGYRVLRARGLVYGCAEELVVNGRIYYSPHHDDRETAARVAHGLAHALLVTETVTHGEPDVWRLTSELLAPYWVSRLLGREALASVCRFCPDWILRHRPTLESVA
jgi:hypothetical protein